MASAGLQQRGLHSFRFRVTVGGKQEWRSVPAPHNATKTAATKYMHSYTSGGATVAPTNERFKAFAEKWIEDSNLKAKTKKEYRAVLANHLVPIWHLKVSELTADHVRNVLKLMVRDGKPYAGRTKRNVFNLISVICQTAVARGILGSNPAKALESREKPKPIGRSFKRILTADEGARLLQGAREYARNETGQWETMLAVALYGGLRLGEILQLQWRHVWFDREVPVLHLEEDDQMHLKGEEGSREKASNRDIELPATLVAMLKTHRRESHFRGPDHYVFSTVTGRPYSARNVSRMLSDVVDRAGLYDERRPITFHVLRHNFGSKLISRGHTAATVQRQMGHADPAITLRIYTHEDLEARREGSVAATMEEAYATFKPRVVPV